MGRFAQVLGIGVHGGVVLELHKYEYYAGEFVFGHAKLKVNDAIDANGFVLKLGGKEHLAWHQQQGKHHHHHHIRRQVFQQEIALLASRTTFQPGEYVFPFQFQLPPDLPNSIGMFKRDVGHIRRVTSSIMYRLKAIVKLEGMMNADFGDDKAIGVHALPRLPSQPPSPLEDMTNRPVTFMCCFNKGQCKITGGSSTSAVDLVNGAVRVRGAVQNESSTEIQAVYVRLYQDFTVHIPQGFTHGGLNVSSSRCIHQQEFGSIPPGGSKDDISADFTMMQIVSGLSQAKDTDQDYFGDARLVAQPFTQLPVMPTLDMVFASISYHIAVHCSFSWCSDIALELPLHIHLPPLMAAPIPVAYAQPNPPFKEQ